MSRAVAERQTPSISVAPRRRAYRRGPVAVRSLSALPVGRDRVAEPDGFPLPPREVDASGVVLVRLDAGGAGVTDYEVYAAFTYAQMSRGGETGDGYQLGVNEFGTHCGKPYGRVIRDGDVLNLYVSNVTYHGYAAQTARMMVVGTPTAKQEEVLEMTVDAVRRAEKLIRPGLALSTLHDAAFDAYVERGYLTSKRTRDMPFNWEAMPDGTPRAVPYQYVADKDWEAQGRKLMHVYPATLGPHNPNLGHQIDLPPGGPEYNVTSHNTDIMQPGMVFVLHAQWLEPLVAGSNIGDLYLVTEDGYENLSHHTPLEPYRAPAQG
ncbi:M24 family metallopeptidase [Streptomyces sp. NPDC057486]|uniref:M24 family metallopeptidase n=1 Tax=Streptomyces sp. NPDC057486 TaxID=3346145 RepID=UPI0036B74E78